MKIAFFNIFGEMKNAEQETLLRLEYCFQKFGHSLVVFNREGLIISQGKDKGKYVEDVHPDFMFTYNTLDLAVMTFPDIFSVFFHWSPLGFVANFQTLLELQAFNIYDMFATTYEQDVFNRVANITTYAIPFIGSSVPADFAVPAREHTDRRLFYVGINFERKLVKMRYEELFKNLDASSKIDIYGPMKVYGHKNLWAGFKCYRGEIPFDGKSIIRKINEAGVCLAINSPMHTDANGVSNRTYEAAAAGALIISDDNKFVRHYFKDTVFYIGRDLSEEESSKKILNILEWANENPKDAYEMAKSSNEIFIKQLSLEKMVEETLDKVVKVKNILQDKERQHDIVDIICFVDSVDDFKKIYKQLKKQFYKNLHLIIISVPKIYEDVKKLSDFKIDFVEKDAEFKGRSFYRAIKYLQGKYFMFIDKASIMHQRHIYKNLDILKNHDTLFSYSGCYLKNKNSYTTLSSSPILRDEFLSFSHAYGIDWHARDMQSLFIETIFSRGCALFKKEILDFCDEKEITYISDSVHFYLACCSIIKAKKLGRFTYTCTTGYQANSLQEINEKIFTYRRYWNENCRSARTYIKEMNEAFFKYTFETTPDFFPHRREPILWFKDVTVTQTPVQSSPITYSKWMQKILQRAEKYHITRMPRFMYKIFSQYCKFKSLINKEHKK
ncbi:glycosyltransferase family protein [Candidatus Avelusimicrobium caledoniensis]|uniref:glycosyltransferase family protein n=1 Tax=Candidatus Avelusimicrobium caledoniensis TaxID=3416220 RepID=UPI003D0AE13B